MEKHMDILQACVMVPLRAPTGPVTSARFLSTKEDRGILGCRGSQRFVLPREQKFPMEPEVCSTVV